MAFEPEAIKKLSQELDGGYKLNIRLLALLRQPLDGRGQEEAMAMSEELSRVFMVSMFMLNPHDNGVEEVRTAPAHDKRICDEEITTLGKGEDTRKEITPYPYTDGYQWKKYGQKTIQNRKFTRYYYKCTFSHDRGCRAKKQAQQQDTSSSDPPMFEVTYINEHTCQRLQPNENNITTSLHTTTTTTTTAGNDGARGPGTYHIGGDVQAENDAIVSCLAKVIGGAATPSSSSSSSSGPPAPVTVEASPGDPASAYVPAGGGVQSPSLDEERSMADHEMWVAEMDTLYSPLFSPVGAAESIDDHHYGVVPMDMVSPRSWTHREYVVWH